MCRATAQFRGWKLFPTTGEKVAAWGPRTPTKILTTPTVLLKGLNDAANPELN